MGRFFKYINRHKPAAAAVTAALGGCALILLLIFMPEAPGRLYGVWLSAAVFCGALLLCGVCLAACGIGLFINIAYWTLFFWLGFSLFIIPYFAWGSAAYYIAAADMLFVLLYKPMRRLAADAAQSGEAQEKFSELAEKIYRLAAPDFVMAESLSSTPAAYRSHTDGNILTVYNLTVYEGYDLLMTRCLHIFAVLDTDAKRTSRMTDRLRSVKNAFFSGFRVYGQSGRFIAYIYYSPVVAPAVYKRVGAIMRAYDRDAVVESTRDAEWHAAKSLIPAERFVLSDINDVICAAAENAGIIDTESNLYFHIVLHSRAEVKPCAEEASSRGYTPFYAYGEDDDFLLILTRVMTVNKDSLDACTDMLSDIASSFGGRVGGYGYGFDEDVKREELKDCENVLR